MNKLNIPIKNSGDALEASEFNSLISKTNELVDSVNEGGSGEPIDTSGVISVSSKGNVTLGSTKNVNIEPAWNNNEQSYTGNYGDIALKPGDDIQLCSHHREPKKRDKIVVKNIDGSDNPVKMQVVAGELDLAVGTSKNPKTATKKKDKNTGLDTSEPMFKSSDAKTFDVRILTGTTLDAGTDDEREERGYLKVRAQAIDLRCEKHGGIALLPKGYDEDGNMNKIKFEHGGGDGLEFGTFNTEKTSLYTDEYRFKKDGVWKMATRETTPNTKTVYDDNTPTGKLSTAALKYVKQADDFYDIIDVADEQCTTKDIIKTAAALNGTSGIHTHMTSKGNLEIESNAMWQVLEDQELTYTQVGIVSADRLTKLHPANLPNTPHTLTELLSCFGTETYELIDSEDVVLSVDTVNQMDAVEIVYDILQSIDESSSDFVKFTKVSSPDINIESDSNIKITAQNKIKFGGELDFGSSFNFGETDNGIEVQYKLTKKGATKNCGIVKVVGVNNNATSLLVVEGITIEPGQTAEVASCSILDMIKLVNYMKNNNSGPWATV